MKPRQHHRTFRWSRDHLTEENQSAKHSEGRHRSRTGHAGRDRRCARPLPGEAVVKVQACGVCHTDLHYRDGGINDDFPFLLGHEAAGHVEAVGEGMTEIAPGDFVVLNWRAVCGECRACAKGKPQYCFNNAKQRMTLTGGTELSPALGIGAFIEKTLVAAGQCTKVDPQAPATAAGLLGAASWRGSAPPSTPVVSGSGTLSRSSVAAASETLPLRARISLVRRPSSRSMSTRESSTGPRSSVQPTPSTPGTKIRCRRSGG